jgi:hypothetical protein
MFDTVFHRKDAKNAKLVNILTSTAASHTGRDVQQNLLSFMQEISLRALRLCGESFSGRL